jgi:hypothetical protein
VLFRNDDPPVNPVIKTPKLTKRRLSLGKKNSKKQLVVEKVIENMLLFFSL